MGGGKLQDHHKLENGTRSLNVAAPGCEDSSRLNSVPPSSRFGFCFAARLCFNRLVRSLRSKIRRYNKETRIAIPVDVDWLRKSIVRTGIPFFVHMVNLFSIHAVIDP